MKWTLLMVVLGFSFTGCAGNSPPPPQPGTKKVEVHAPGVDVNVEKGGVDVKAPGADVEIDRKK